MVVDHGGARHRFDLTMTVSVDKSGKLIMDTEPISVPINKLFVILCLRGKVGGNVPEFRFWCRSDDGKRFASDRAYLTSYKESFPVGDANASVRVAIHIHRARLSMNAPVSSNTPVLQFTLPKFLCFSISLQTGSGQVGIISASQDERQSPGYD